MSSHRQPLDVLEDEIIGVEFRYNANKILNQAVSGIVKRTFADHRKALAGSPADNDVNFALDSGNFPNVVAREVFNRAGNHRAAWEIEMMDAGVDWIDLDGGGNIKPGLLEAERHAARACK